MTVVLCVWPLAGEIMRSVLEHYLPNAWLDLDLDPDLGPTQASRAFVEYPSDWNLWGPWSRVGYVLFSAGHIRLRSYSLADLCVTGSIYPGLCLDSWGMLRDLVTAEYMFYNDLKRRITWLHFFLI